MERRAAIHVSTAMLRVRLDLPPHLTIAVTGPAPRLVALDGLDT
ncbi:MAG TPA: hypothetical protein VF167_09540 [Longimicrobiaceae bacterium]